MTSLLKFNSSYSEALISTVIANIKLIEANVRKLYICEYADIFADIPDNDIEFTKLNRVWYIYLKKNHHIIFFSYDALYLGTLLGYVEPSSRPESKPVEVIYSLNSARRLDSLQVLFIQKVDNYQSSKVAILAQRDEIQKILACNVYIYVST